MEGGYSMGIKTARIATENAKADFKTTKKGGFQDHH
jgi:hypothetical protein